ncbi:hypothetical protein V6M85_13995 (plasmid) [Sulfolobus tengchongensis]|uniref:Uncharacterized protein n=1 Tax=Sulfolobus tengchongensis TaxID=207809 RepID=A0AAX4L5H9_9CREN
MIIVIEDLNGHKEELHVNSTDHCDVIKLLRELGDIWLQVQDQGEIVELSKIEWECGFIWDNDIKGWLNESYVQTKSLLGGKPNENQ